MRGEEESGKVKESESHILCLLPQIAGIIVDSYARGQYKHIWFSVSHDLRMDAERCVNKEEGGGGGRVCVQGYIYNCLCSSFLLPARDLHDIGCHIKVIDGCQQLDRETRYIPEN